MSLGRQEAFEIFKRDYADSVTIEDNKQLLKQRFAEAKSLGERVNEARTRINQLKGEVEQRRMQKAALGVSDASIDVKESDPVEEHLRSQMEEEKKKLVDEIVNLSTLTYLGTLREPRYKTLFNRLKGLKTEIEHLQLLLEKAKVRLQKDFEVWWSEEATSLQAPRNNAPINNSSGVWRNPSDSPQESQQQISSIRVSEALPTGDSALWNSVRRTSSPASERRTPQSVGSSIPLTGDSQTDADILAFVKARQNLMQRKGFGTQ